MTSPPRSPLDEYRERLRHFTAIHSARDERYRRLGNARLVTGLAALVLVAFAIGVTWVSPWWLALPAIVFIALAVVHNRVDEERSHAARAIGYYESGLARLENRWIGKGNQGERFRNPQHLYADDIDIFGAGSLFELICAARTHAGEQTLARWFLQPADVPTVQARQQAVEELKPNLDLRQEIGLIGEDIRAAVDDGAMRAWGSAPPVHIFKGARWIALSLALAALTSFVLFMAQIWSLRPFLVVIFAEMLFHWSLRDSVKRITSAVTAPASDLRVLGDLLARLEQERFSSPRLQEIAHGLGGGTEIASAEIRELEKWVDRLDWTRNQFFRGIASPLLWIPQCAIAIENWRQRCGRHIGDWVAAIGEFEALSSLAGFAYERPSTSFPELSEKALCFHGEEVQHPLLDPHVAVPNNVTLDSTSQLWVISGSNMSGKSTLLRAVGLNLVLAWAGAPVCCKQLRVSALQLGASIRVNDSLADNKSRFYAEISRLRDIVNQVKDGVPTLFLLDELLSGTNSHDRRIGAAAVVKGLVERGAIGLVTTHDLALAAIADSLDGRARNLHFEDHMEGHEMRFDYRLKPGVVERSNALELMRAVGLDV